MQFRPEHISLILAGKKTQTRRVCKQKETASETVHVDTWTTDIDAVYDANDRVRWEVGYTYAVQPGRGKPAVARIRITGIRQERLQDISPDDVWAEGIRCSVDHGPLDIGFNQDVWDLEVYRLLWDDINRKPGTRWRDNPRVWVIEFELVENA